MKKKNLVLFMMVAVCMISVSSCGEDEKEKKANSSSVAEVNESKSTGKDGKSSKEKKPVTNESLEGTYDFGEKIYRTPKNGEEGWYRILQLHNPYGEIVALSNFASDVDQMDRHQTVIKINSVARKDAGATVDNDKVQHSSDEIDGLLSFKSSNIVEIGPNNKQTHVAYKFSDDFFEYDSDGNLVCVKNTIDNRIRRFDWSTGKAMLISDEFGYRFKKYDIYGKVISVYGEYAQWDFEYERDSKGNIVHRKTNTHGIGYDKDEFAVYEYDANDNITYIKYTITRPGYYDDETILSLEVEKWYEYDDRGNVIYHKQSAISGHDVIEESFPDSLYYSNPITNGVELIIDFEEKCLGIEYRYEYEYDSNGNIILKKTDVVFDKKDPYFNASHDLLGWRINNYTSSRIDRYEYDKNGNLIGENGYRYKYDANGNITKKESFRYNDKDGIITDGDNPESWYKYEYDSNGKLMHETYYSYNYSYDKWYVRGREIPIKGIVDLKYDPNGNPIRFTFANTEWMETKIKGEKLNHWIASDGQEEWYDKKGILVCRKSANGKKTWYDYDYYKNGKVKIMYFMEE